MTTLMQASHQWASRPADQRFLDLNELLARTQQGKDNSTGKVVATKHLQFEPMEDHKGLKIAGQNGVAADVTHWSFGQLAGLAKAPAGYLRELPAELVADNLNYGLKFRREIDEVGVLLTRESVSVDGFAAPASRVEDEGRHRPELRPHLERGHRPLAGLPLRRRPDRRLPGAGRVRQAGRRDPRQHDDLRLGPGYVRLPRRRGTPHRHAGPPQRRAGLPRSRLLRLELRGWQHVVRRGVLPLRLRVHEPHRVGREAVFGDAPAPHGQRPGQVAGSGRAAADGVRQLGGRSYRRDHPQRAAEEARLRSRRLPEGPEVQQVADQRDPSRRPPTRALSGETTTGRSASAERAT